MPLSDYERRVLEEMEAQLSSDDPKLATSMSTPQRPSRRGRVSLGLLLAIGGLALLVGGLAVSQLWLSLIGFAALFAGAWIALSTPKPAQPATPGAPPAPGPSRSGRRGLAQRFEDRFNNSGE
jgi:hypothetical protein